MTQDQVHVPKTRSQLGLPALDPAGEDLYGGSVTDAVKSELWDALGDSPIGAAVMSMGPLVSISAELRIAIGRTHIIFSSLDGHFTFSQMHLAKRGILLGQTVSLPVLFDNLRRLDIL